MANIWEDVFGVQNIGIDDDFFSLGGDSVSGIRLVSRANQAGIHLETVHLFECYTIRQIFDKHSQSLSATLDEPEAPVLEQKPWQERLSDQIKEELKHYTSIEDVYPMTPVQEGLYLTSFFSSCKECYSILYCTHTASNTHRKWCGNSIWVRTA